MPTIIIADNLTNDHCNPDVEFLNNRHSIGSTEIDRLFYDNGKYGEGILPKFLVEYMKKKEKQDGLILFRDLHDPNLPEHKEILNRTGDYALKGSKGAEFLSILDRVSGQALIIESSGQAAPINKLINAITKILNQKTPFSPETLESVNFLIVGCHTDRRVMYLAILLRKVLGFHNVAVSPHLVGSRNREAHFITLRHYLPEASVHILSEIDDMLNYIGLPAMKLPFKLKACEVLPVKLRKELSQDTLSIVQNLCMHWTKTELTPLKGGYSGSYLFLANGWKGSMKTEPLVIKIDQHWAIQKELDGFESARDLLGKHIPTLSPPISKGEQTGISMELASMEGRPETLQDYYESANDDAGLEKFLGLFRRTLELLVDKVYKNTMSTQQYAPYRHYLMHVERQSVWLDGNLQSIAGQDIGEKSIDMDLVKRMFDHLRKNDDSVFSKMCLAHGDLNMANVICDERENIWAIDWTHAGIHPLENDITKLENDLKFVMNKDFDSDDFKKLKLMEDYLLTKPIPEDVDKLPTNLKFIKWDFRFKKMLTAIRLLRQTYFKIIEKEDWLTYQIGLLRYSIHTMSFDESRGRGECGPVQLWYALYSAEQLLYQLMADDFHLKIRGERPDSYPERQRISIDQTLWKIPCEEYSPHYYVSQEVIDNDHTKQLSGWAHSEENFSLENESSQKDLIFDKDGRPLNPHGRTGIAGRGLLGRWGPNPVLLPLIVRVNPIANDLELLLVEHNSTSIGLLTDFINFNQTQEEAIQRLFQNKLKLDSKIAKKVDVYDGYLYDFRQTDHAWIQAHCVAYFMPFDIVRDTFTIEESSELKWRKIDTEIINKMPSSHAMIIRNSIEKLNSNDLISDEITNALIKLSG